MTKKQSDKPGLARLYVYSFAGGLYLILNGCAALKSGNGFLASVGGGSGHVYLSGSGASQYSTGKIVIGAAVDLIALIGLIGLAVKRGP